MIEKKTTPTRLDLQQKTEEVLNRFEELRGFL